MGSWLCILFNLVEHFAQESNDFNGVLVLDWKIRRLLGTVVAWLCTSICLGYSLLILLRSGAVVSGCAGGLMELQSCLQVVLKFYWGTWLHRNDQIILMGVLVFDDQVDWHSGVLVCILLNLVEHLYLTGSLGN